MMLDQPSQEDIKYGQIIYGKKSLPLYDLIVTRFSNRFAWKCPRTVLIDFFRENISDNHLDIGVGTGYFLAKANLIPGKQRIGLLDLNDDCLAFASMKLRQYNPEVYRHDVFTPFTSISKKFDSVSLNYVLHCLPGKLQQKAVAFDHIKTVLNFDGKLFGSTILGKGTAKNWLAEKLLQVYNQKKYFGNLDDDHEILLNELHKRFTRVEIKIKGYVALFVATH